MQGSRGEIDIENRHGHGKMGGGQEVGRVAAKSYSLYSNSQSRELLCVTFWDSNRSLSTREWMGRVEESLREEFVSILHPLLITLTFGGSRSFIIIISFVFIKQSENLLKKKKNS